MYIISLAFGREVASPRPHMIANHYRQQPGENFQRQEWLISVQTPFVRLNIFTINTHHVLILVL